MFANQKALMSKKEHAQSKRDFAAQIGGQGDKETKGQEGTTGTSGHENNPHHARREKACADARNLTTRRDATCPEHTARARGRRAPRAHKLESIHGPLCLR